MGAAVYELGQLSHLMLLPLERICVTFSLNSINPCSVWKKPLLLDRGNPFSLGGVFDRARFLLSSGKQQRTLHLLELEGSRERRHPLSPALPFTEISSNIPVLKAEVLGCYLMKGTVIESLFKTILEEKKTLMYKELWLK